MTYPLLFIALCCCRRMVSELVFDIQKNCCILCFLKMVFHCIFLKLVISVSELKSRLPACLPACLKCCWLSLECCRYGSDAELWWALGLVGKNKGVRQRCTGIHSDIFTTRSCCCFFDHAQISESSVHCCLSLPAWSFLHLFPKCSEHCVI